MSAVIPPVSAPTLPPTPGRRPDGRWPLTLVAFLGCTGEVTEARVGGAAVELMDEPTYLCGSGCGLDACTGQDCAWASSVCQEWGGEPIFDLEPTNDVLCREGGLEYGCRFTCRRSPLPYDDGLPDAPCNDSCLDSCDGYINDCNRECPATLDVCERTSVGYRNSCDTWCSANDCEPLSCPDPSTYCGTLYTVTNACGESRDCPSVDCGSVGGYTDPDPAPSPEDQGDGGDGEGDGEGDGDGGGGGCEVESCGDSVRASSDCNCYSCWEWLMYCNEFYDPDCDRALQMCS